MASKLKGVPHDFPALDIVLSFIAGRGDEAPHPSGSGVFIAPGLALTATHVLNDYADRFDDTGKLESSGESNFSVQAIQYRPGEAEPLVWDVWAAQCVSPLDIAVVQMRPHTELPVDYVWPYTQLDVAPPEIGTKIQAFGFPLSAVKFDEQTGEWFLSESAAGSVGTVTQVFQDKRDSVVMPFPSFEMDIQVLGGMSGGPVFDSSGHLRGILCSSFEFGDDAADVSYASMLWPALALSVQGTANLGISDGAYVMIKDLAARGHLHVLNYENAKPLSFDSL